MIIIFDKNNTQNALLSKFGDISFQEYVSKGISHPVFYGDLVYKLRRVKDTPNLNAFDDDSMTHWSSNGL